MKGLGRVYLPDPRDRFFAMADVIPTDSTRKYRYWNATGWWGNQGASSQCVGYSWVHWLEDGPVTHSEPAPLVKPEVVYEEAQEVDEWEGSDYEGTSVRAGAKALRARGWISEYRWAFTWDEVRLALLERGPVVVGIDWWSGMDRPDSNGVVRATGSIRGGHAILADGITLRKGLVRLKNSWSRSWGRYGFCFLPIDELEYLLFGANGEAVLAVENREAVDRSGIRRT